MMDVKVCAVMVGAEEEEKEDEKKDEAAGEQGPEMSEPEVEGLTARVCILKGYISRELVQLETLPAWHVLPNGVVLRSDPVALNFLERSENFGPQWPARMTFDEVT